MTTGERAWPKGHTRAEDVRARRARQVRVIEPAPKERKRVKAQRRRPRRRFDLPLKQDRSIEAQLPAVPALHPGARLLSLFLLILIGITLGRILTASAFRVHGAVVQGNQLLTGAQVRSLAEVEGLAIFAVDPRTVAARLEGVAEVLSIQVRVSWPNTVEIEVQERVPIVEWNDGGRIWWLSEDGVAFIHRGSDAGLVRVESSEMLLNVDEQELKPVLDPSLLQATVALQALLPEEPTLVYDREYGLAFVDEMGRQIFFGHEGDMGLKVKIYRSLIARLGEGGLLASSIHLEDSAAAYYRLEG